MITSAMARRRCLPRSKSPPERSSPRTQNGVVASSFSSSWTVSWRLFPTASFTSFSTTSTRTKRTRPGSQAALPFHPNAVILAQSGRGVVFDLAGAVAQRHLLHKPQAAAGSHRCLRQRIQRQSRAFRLDQEKGSSTPLQRPPYHSALLPGTRAARDPKLKSKVVEA